MTITKTVTTAFFATLFATVALFAVAQPASAACSYNGWVNSNGKCSASFQNSSQRYQYTYQNQYQSSYNAQQDAALLAQIEYLLAMIKQLQAIVEAREGGSVSSGNADVDVTTRSASNIDDDRATLRGRVDFNREDEATVWFQYGRSSSNLDRSTSRVVLDEDDDDEDFALRITNLREDTRYYFRAVAEDEDGDRDYGSTMSFTTDDDGRSSRNDDEPDVDTDEADDVEDNSAKLNGSVDMNDFNSGRVFFVWGEDEDQVEDISDDYDTYDEVDEDGEDLQKELIDSDLDGEEDYTERVTGLDEDTDIFFAICVEYEDEDDDELIECGGVEEFTTGEDDRTRDDEPEAETGDTDDVTETSARFEGIVDMNDWDNGLAFFVYGQDEDELQDIPDDYDTYSDIDVDWEDVMKIAVDYDSDGTTQYNAQVWGLDDDTDYYYAMCVEWDDDGDESIVCGTVEDFTTDED